MSTLNVLVQSALDYIYQQDPNFVLSVNRSDIEASLQDALDRVMPDELTLASDKPDYEAIVFSMVQRLQTDNAWKDVVHTATGQTLIRNIAAGITYLHFGIVKATQNVFLTDNASKSSVYQGMNSLGVNIRRRVPQKLKVRLSIPDRETAYVIPRFTQFTIADVDFFNREAITYTEFDISKDVILSQGTIYQSEGSASGIPFETIEIGYENFSISNEDVYVEVNGEFWLNDPKLKPWMASDKQNVFFTKTLETGNVQLRFGNGLYGSQLPAEATLKLIWAETLGLDAKQVPTDVGFAFNNLDLPIEGLTLSSSYGGDNELDTKFYSIMGPHIRASNGYGIRRSDFKSLALQYPFIRDALFRGQAEIAPDKRNWMNVVEVTLLTATGIPLMDVEWEDFINFMQQRSVSRLDYLRRDPVLIEVNVSAEIHCTTSSNLAEIEATLVNRVLEYSVPRMGAIGYSIYASDIIEILEGNSDTPADNLSKNIEFTNNFKFDYADTFDYLSLPEGTGINETGDGVIANYICYIKIVGVNLDVKYTPRRTYLGRSDLAIEG